MPELFEIKQRIEGLKSIHNITYAMQIVTISRLRRITNQLLKSKSSVVEIEKIVEYLASEDSKFAKKISGNSKKATDEKPVIVMFFSNRGFCGSFNQDVVAHTHQYLEKQSLDFQTVHKVCVGKKASLFVKPSVQNVTFFTPEKDLISASELNEVYDYLLPFIAKGAPIHFVYFNFKSIVSQSLTVEPYALSFDADQLATKPLQIKKYVDPSTDVAQEKIINYYYHQKLLNVIKSSACSEFSQRFLLMKSAVDNVKELTDELLLEHNKERQRMITQEITEIISTFKTLKK